MYANFIKPLFDFIISSIAFLMLSPIFFVLTLLLTIANKGTPFFIQPRVGQKGQIFTIIKFRTMNNLKDEQGDLLSDDKRLTWIGKIVRKTSLDEIPQLFNVMKGEMSIVGPRPLLIEYLPLYSDYQKRRHEVKPGLTGWVAVNGRNSLSWDEKFKLDVWYVDHQSFWLDLKIIMMTIVKVLKREGINSSTSETMEKFQGGE
jgi:lipopolysaccharide/colanic/teichoic acid biosynthesis glycosyltransferase